MELRRRLEAPDLTLHFADLRAADVQRRAVAFKHMVSNGMDVKEALALSGLMSAEG